MPRNKIFVHLDICALRLDKLKHVPQCAARKLSAVRFQLLSGMKLSRRAKNMEG
jgi:hypothetical protein